VTGRVRPIGLRGKIQLSLHQKLIGLTAVMITTIVACLTIYFPLHEIQSVRGMLNTRVAGYGAMMSSQVRSAVAFSDRATATEVLASLTADPDLAAATLFGAHGERLYQHGEPSSWTDRAREGVVSPRVFSMADRVAVVTPVETLEGPVGTLVIELSTDRMEVDLRRIVITAVAAGAAALAFGIAAAWFIARSVARRLSAIARVATAVASGASPGGSVDDSSSDEIGSLAGAFNHMVDQLARVHRELEERVQARTAELTTANQHLVVEMEQRSRMELELRQAQKLESVGRLASGIAHEINTPVQFVSDSCQFLRDACVDVREAIETYRQIMVDIVDGTTGCAAAASQARQMEADNDLDYLMENIPLAADRSIEGLDRVAAIVRAMKEFAYPERKERALADINHAIETTLVVSASEYKYQADVKTELGEIPKVMCHIGEFNQVMLNMVVNAAHAIQDVVEGTGEKGEIAIRTWADGPDVMISIRDSGKGIPPATIEKIFDPFFTTKAFGKGTGQGLAIARSVIVDKHRGKLTVASQVGQGTTFTIALPIDGGARTAAAV
jgi:signal transduction histidine kinase